MPKKKEEETVQQVNEQEKQMLAKLPKEAQDKLKDIKKKLDDFKKKVLEKFEKYVAGIALLPPQKKEGEEKPDTNKIHVMLLIDDSDSQKMSKLELKEKLEGIMANIAKEIDPNIVPQIVILSDLWQSCYDGKSELAQTIALSAPIHDTGMLSAVKIAEIHKTMVLKKFEKYIVSYVLSGSLIRGQATQTSDIDVFLVIDDTDVKKMTRAELKDKLRAIIIGMGIEAGEMTGIRNKLNIQVYILTEFWDSLREANPIIFTLLRDGVPFYDRGLFMPWKQMLKMGKIKPSQEAIDMFMGSGEQMLKRVSLKIKDIAMEDIFYALLTPSQAALMLFGVAPPTPRETTELMREIFVKKEKLLEDKYVTILEKVIKTRKELEHGTKKDVTGKEVDQLLSDAEKYLARIKRLFTQIEKIKEEETMLHIYESVVTVIRDVLRLEGIEKVSDKEMVDFFEKEMVLHGKIPEKYLRILHEIMKAKADYDKNTLTKADVDNARKNAAEFTKFIIEYMQRKRGRELERAKIRVKYGAKFGEVILMDKLVFIIHEIDTEEKKLSRGILTADGDIMEVKESTLEQYEEALAKTEIPPKVFIKEKTFEKLKSIFGKDVEILVNY